MVSRRHDVNGRHSALRAKDRGILRAQPAYEEFDDLSGRALDIQRAVVPVEHHTRQCIADDDRRDIPHDARHRPIDKLAITLVHGEHRGHVV